MATHNKPMTDWQPYVPDVHTCWNDLSNNSGKPFGWEGTLLPSGFHGSTRPSFSRVSFWKEQQILPWSNPLLSHAGSVHAEGETSGEEEGLVQQSPGWKTGHPPMYSCLTVTTSPFESHNPFDKKVNKETEHVKGCWLFVEGSQRLLSHFRKHCLGSVPTPRPNMKPWVLLLRRLRCLRAPAGSPLDLNSASRAPMTIMYWSFRETASPPNASLSPLKPLLPRLKHLPGSISVSARILS